MRGAGRARQRRGASGPSELGRGERVGLGQRAGLAWEKKGLGWALGFGLLWVWVLGWFSIFLSTSLTFLNLIQTKFEFKFEFEFKPHSNKIMHQHECNKKN
jgi:hypothetical protein